ncbi:MAG: hypothetical protein EXR91_12665 [Gemmatimonadetes bacterium]|nr:hypothetical protein [Gemmatimonadota bacterium]
MSNVKKYSPATRERAVRLVLEHEEEYPSQWAAIESIAEKIGCTTQTLRSWVRQAERDAGMVPGLKTEERERARHSRMGLVVQPSPPVRTPRPHSPG